MRKTCTGVDAARHTEYPSSSVDISSTRMVEVSSAEEAREMAGGCSSIDGEIALGGCESGADRNVDADRFWEARSDDRSADCEGGAPMPLDAAAAEAEKAGGCPGSWIVGDACGCDGCCWWNGAA